MQSILTRRRSKRFRISIAESQFVKCWEIFRASLSSLCERDFIGELPALHSEPTPVPDKAPIGDGLFLILEYERSRPSPRVPYPVGFERLFQLFSETGVTRVEKLATRRSRFGGTMYSAFAERPE